MRLMFTIIFAAMFAAIAVAGVLLSPAESAPLPSSTAAAKAESPAFEQAIYKGWRASPLLGNPVFSLKGEYLGDARNILLDDRGQIRFVVVEGAGIRNSPEYMFRIPWERIVRPLHTRALIADFSDFQSREYGLFFDPDRREVASSDFAISEVIGDYARLQAGQGYGYVSDLVFNQDGRLFAILVSRDASAGGGTYAFPFPGDTGKWSPNMSYYGLPYVTEEGATKAGLRVSLDRFQRQS